MILKNFSNGKIICKDLKIASSFADRMFGLLIKKNPGSLLFNTRFGIHTFFLKEPIDILILDKNFKVVKIKQSLKPNRLFFWDPKYYLVIELPRGAITKSNIRQDQTLLIC